MHNRQGKLWVQALTNDYEILLHIMTSNRKYTVCFSITNVVIIKQVIYIKQRNIQTISWFSAFRNQHLLFMRTSENVYITQSRIVFYVFASVCLCRCSWLVGLDLFNDDTRPSGRISRPLSQWLDLTSCVHSVYLTSVIPRAGFNSILSPFRHLLTKPV